MAENKPAPITIDIGTHVTKTGFAGEDAPRSVFPSYVGRPQVNTKQLMTNDKHQDVYVGPDALARKGILTLKRPVESGHVTDFHGLEDILRYSYTELGVQSQDQPSILVRALNTPLNQQEKLAKIMFENLKVPALYMGPQEEFSLFANGKTNGCVVSSGYGVSAAVPIYKGRIIVQAVQSVNIAGSDVTNYLKKMLIERGFPGDIFKSDPARLLASDIKHKLCYISGDSADAEIARFSATESSDLEKTYELPDGNIITLGNERFMCPEVIFDPGMIAREAYGIHQATYTAIMACDLDIREELFANIVLTGGNMQFDGIDQRLKKEVSSLLPVGTNVNVTKQQNCQYSAWVGASIIGNLDGFEQWLISRAEYDEVGPAVIRKGRQQ